MFRLGAIVLVLVTAMFAGDYKKARIIDFQEASTVAGGTESSPSNNGVSTMPTSRFGSSILKCEVVLALDGTTYTALFPEDSKFQIADLTRGAMISVRIDGKKVSMQRPSDGKEIKGKILREEKETPAQK